MAASSPDESSARDGLVDRLLEHAASNGFSDSSLRELASAVGTSHRMLIYHFGSRDGVIAAVVERMETNQRTELESLAEEATTPTDLIARQWAHLSDPAIAPFVRLFFEIAAHAMFGRPGTEGFIESLTDPWIELGTRLAEHMGAEADAAAIRLGIAVSRGLLLDAVASGDPRPATDAMQRFLQMWEATASTRLVPPPLQR